MLKAAEDAIDGSDDLVIEASVSAARSGVPERATASAFWRPDWLLILTASFAIVWIVHRALVQSITLDEATTYHFWVAPDGPAYWQPHSNNHVLNSILIRVFIWLFGLSHLTVRAPALIGGVVYIYAAYRLCVLLSRSVLLHWTLFVCLVYNPFIMDYLVVARGYGLALGFFLLAIYLLARTLVRRHEAGDRQILNYAAGFSACVGMSFCANFSFGYAGAFLLLVGFVLWSVQERKRGLFAWARLLLACAVPAFAIVLFVAGPVLADFPRAQLFWGARSLRDTWLEIYDASFGEFNRYLVNSTVADFLSKLKPHLIRAEIRFTFLSAVLMLFSGRLRSAAIRFALVLAAALTSVLFLTLLAHWLQFRFLQIPLPFERTSLFLVPLGTAIVGVVLSVKPANLLERVARGFAIAVMFIISVYFLGTLRDSYFREWSICADLRSAFPVAAELSRRTGVRDFPSDLNYTGTLNFYRILNRVKHLDELQNFEKMPPGKAIYVIPEGPYADFIRTEGLKVAYHGTVSDVVVVYRPDAVTRQD